MRMLQVPDCGWVIFVDTRKLGDKDYFIVRERNRVDARKTAASYRRQNCRTVIRGGLGGLAIVPKWYVANKFDKMVDTDYLSGN